MFIFGTFAQILFPDFCVKCKQFDTLLCPSCAHLLPVSPKNHLPIISRYSYRDTQVQFLLKSLKQRPQELLASTLGHSLTDVVFEYICDQKNFHQIRKWCVIPIPLSPKRLQERGYNQSELIANGFCKNELIQSVIVNNLLYRYNQNNKQALTQSRIERFKNTRNSFWVSTSHKLQPDIGYIIIDDITTSGATLLAARDTLINAGVRNIICCAVAH